MRSASMVLLAGAVLAFSAITAAHEALGAKM